MPKLEEAIGKAVNPVSGDKERLTVELLWQYLIGAVLLIGSLIAGSAIVSAIAGWFHKSWNLAGIPFLGKPAQPAATGGTASAQTGPSLYV